MNPSPGILGLPRGQETSTEELDDRALRNLRLLKMSQHPSHLVPAIKQALAGSWTDLNVYRENLRKLDRTATAMAAEFLTTKLDSEDRDTRFRAYTLLASLDDPQAERAMRTRIVSWTNDLLASAQGFEQR